LVGTNRDSPHGLETGYCINIAYWGHGYASEGFAAFLKLFWALEERRDVSFLVGKVDPENLASARIMQKSGARKTEHLKGIWKKKLDDGQEQERDVICWIIERPAGTEGKHVGDEKTDTTQSTPSS
jgi:RimJ/RimL family protein N-acetyltransferase